MKQGWTETRKRQTATIFEEGKRKADISRRKAKGVNQTR